MHAFVGRIVEVWLAAVESGGISGAVGQMTIFGIELQVDHVLRQFFVSFGGMTNPLVDFETLLTCKQDLTSHWLERPLDGAVPWDFIIMQILTKVPTKKLLRASAILEWRWRGSHQWLIVLVGGVKAEKSKSSPGNSTGSGTRDIHFVTKRC